ncbi:type IV secretory system conjugative DNA transfer family protein [Helicobacter winghamensis]|uniref:Type IV secretory system conjugative DNA transfer family protein n=1 Tax=Helicobacter winghamensis TaxID=157268 RepID=A0A2N3PKB1_9HELI|nr:type IV secretory system conjugative DNA transfer family protein [Helicobacter winghamensis]PKT77588.1 hypothetical protein BCM32_05185 [Helicobacter winghamensis]PKT81827.1 hypothetical protein BCM31_01180 [Helicobacter winghamensis]PKT82005.1 hypothetical protein BCM33_00445 [Helicobacter winghamensis]QOQ98598.1 type IV secretory system conjugative DNA transfer family protein [Helicobacter winghamensis]
MDKKRKITSYLTDILFVVILGIFAFLGSIKYIFNPDFKDLIHTGYLILKNVGNPTLKIKAYIPIILGVAPFLTLIIFYFLSKYTSFEQYGSAEFATPELFEKMNICYDKGLVLGSLQKGNKTTPLRATQPFATLIVAPPGSGKTAGIAMPNLLTLHQSCVVFDIKGELFDKTAGYRQKHFNNKILKFSPLKEDNTLFYNPFDKSIVEPLDFNQRKILAEQIAGTIFIGEKGKETDHWLVSAKKLFTFFALYYMELNNETTLGELAQCHSRDYFNFIKKEEFMLELLKVDEHKGVGENKILLDENGKPVRDYDKDTFQTLLKQIAFDESMHEIIRNQARAYMNSAKEEFASVKSTFDTYMLVFTQPMVVNATSKLSFNFRDLREQPITAYIVIQTEEIDILAPLIRIFTESMLKTLMSGQENSDPNKFIYLILDEFVRFGKMNFLLEAPALCRSYGIIPVYITQSYEQIEKYYGKEDLGIIRANVGYQVIFTMNSEKDAQEISKMIGDFTRNKRSTSQGNFDFFKKNDSLSKEAYKLVTAQDIMNMSNEDNLILVKGFAKRPIQSKVYYWFKQEEWKKAPEIKPTEQEVELERNLKREEEYENNTTTDIDNYTQSIIKIKQN